MKSLAFAAVVLSLSAPVIAQTANPAKPADSGVGVRIAFVDPGLAFQQCAEGKATLAKLTALSQRKQTENADRSKQLDANRQKLESSVLTQDARAQLERDIAKQQIELQRFQQDAQSEINSLQQDVQSAFASRLRLVIGEVAVEKGLQIVLNAGEPAIAWVSPSLDVTSDVVKKLDATAKPALLHD
jgi:Skp family chaperone for outer membrane proteins